LHVRVGAVGGSAFDRDIAAVPQLVDVIFNTPNSARLPHQVGANLGGDDLVRPPPPVTSGTPSKPTILASPIESKVPSLPHMQTDAVYIKLQNALL
jgi:hypothetical protein